MALHTWWLYVTAVFLIAGTPGPNMLHVMVQSIHHGPRRALFSMAGLMSAVLLCLLASAMGLGALLKASPRVSTCCAMPVRPISCGWGSRRGGHR